MTSSPTVSVIVPAYNTADFIAEALESVLAQTFADYEIVVVNDGSPDTPRLEAALAPYRERIVYVEQPNRGSSAARNTGLRVARGRFVAFLDSDDRFHPEYLASQLAVLEADPTADVVCCDAERFGGGRDGARYSEEYPPQGEITFSKVLARDWQIYGEVTARTETIRRVGGYDDRLFSAEDYELWLRVLHGGGRIVYNDRVLAYYRVRPGSHTANTRRLTENVLRALEKASTMSSLSAADRASIDGQVREARAELHLVDAKRALAAGEGREALRLLRLVASDRANLKIRIMIAALTVAPGLTARGFRAAANR